jgi:type II secretory pathway pseudopilin PulG
MLIVVSIMMILMAAGASVMRPAGDSRRIREAARAVNIYLSSARNRAMETGRPCGVMLRRFSDTVPCAMNMDQCEVPPCYCGDTEQSVATVRSAGIGTATATLDNNDAPINLLRQYDLIQFNGQGPHYTITNSNDVSTGYILYTPGTTVLTLTYDSTQGQLVPWDTTPRTVSYRIYRSPVKGAATPLQLPAATVVDLDASGVDPPPPQAPPAPANRFSDTNGDVIILFSPNGSINCIYTAGNQYFVTQPIFLLVGKRERMLNMFQPNNTDEQTMMNYQDLNNLWVVINPQTGLINSEPVAAPLASDDTLAKAIDTARGLAREGLGMGGK